ncbi:MAG: PQQ-binding-like beta-propeller repeat protein [bacterium]
MFCSFFVFKVSVNAASISNIYTFPQTLKVSETGTWRVQFTTASVLPKDGKVKITFPAGFNVSNATFINTLYTGATTINGGFSLSVTDQIVTITRDNTGTATNAGNLSIKLSGITNPSIETDVLLSVETLSSINATIDTAAISIDYVGVSTEVENTTSSWPVIGHDSRKSNTTNIKVPEYPTIEKSISIGSSATQSVTLDNEGNNTIGYVYNVKSIDSSGNQRWSVNAPLSAGGSYGIAITAPDNSTYSVHMASDWQRLQLTGINPNGTLKWTYADIGGGNSSGGWNLGLFGGEKGYLYVQTHGNGGGLEIFSVTTGKRVARYTYHSWWAGSVSTVARYQDNLFLNYSLSNDIQAIKIDGTLVWSNSTSYFTNYGATCNDVTVNEDGTKVYLGTISGSKVYAINALTGAKNWEFAADNGGVIRIAPAIYDNKIYFMDGNGIEYALQDNGPSYTVLWRRDTLAASAAWFRHSTILSSASKLLFTQNSQKSFAINSETGAVKWTLGYRDQDLFNPTVDTSGRIRIPTNVAGTTYISYIKNWTIQSLSPIFIGNLRQLQISAKSSMLKRDPFATTDNIVQAVMNNGDKVELTYDSTDNENNTIWKGTWNVPVNVADDSYSGTIEASAYKVGTDISTSFNTYPTGFTSTGITSSVEYTIETTLPDGSVTINNNATYTNIPNVNLTLTGSDTPSGLSSMMVSEDNTFASSVWELFTSTKSITLSSGDGIKTIYFKLLDNAGNVSTTYSDSIILDTINPNPLNISKIGGINISNDTGSLSYYYLGTKVVLTGTGESNNTAYFVFKGKTYQTNVNQDTSFNIDLGISLPDGINKIEYYQKDSSGLISSSRILTLVTGCESNFPQNLKDKYCPIVIQTSSEASTTTSSIESTTSSSTESMSSLSSSLSSLGSMSSTSSSLPNVVTVIVKVEDDNGNPVFNALVVLHSTPKEAYTNREGIATFTNVEKGDHKVNISYGNYSKEQSLVVPTNPSLKMVEVVATPTDLTVNPVLIIPTNTVTKDNSTPINIFVVFALLFIGLVTFVYVVIKRRQKAVTNSLS